VNATVNFVLASSVWAAIGFSATFPAANQTQPNSAQEAVSFEVNCVAIKCQGDFPVSSNRKYADAKRWGIDRDLRPTDVNIRSADGIKG